MAKKMNFCPPGKGEAMDATFNHIERPPTQEEVKTLMEYKPILASDFKAPSEPWSVTLLNIDGTPSTCAYQTSKSAGIDLCVADEVGVTLAAGRRMIVHTGVKLSVIGEPPPMVAMLELRSSMRKLGLTTLGTGIIDMDYPDEILLLVQNVDPIRSVKISAGDRVAQLIFVPIIRPNGIEVKQVERKGGVGSTGK
jgi:dUTP pyrophosphatase